MTCKLEPCADIIFRRQQRRSASDICCCVTLHLRRGWRIDSCCLIGWSQKTTADITVWINTAHSHRIPWPHGDHVTRRSPSWSRRVLEWSLHNAVRRNTSRADRSFLINVVASSAVVSWRVGVNDWWVDWCWTVDIAAASPIRRIGHSLFSWYECSNNNNTINIGVSGHFDSSSAIYEAPNCRLVPLPECLWS